MAVPCRRSERQRVFLQECWEELPLHTKSETSFLHETWMEGGQGSGRKKGEKSVVILVQVYNVLLLFPPGLTPTPKYPPIMTTSSWSLRLSTYSGLIFTQPLPTIYRRNSLYLYTATPDPWLCTLTQFLCKQNLAWNKAETSWEWGWSSLGTRLE